MRLAPLLVLLGLLGAGGCRGGSQEDPPGRAPGAAEPGGDAAREATGADDPPRLPDDDAGRLIARAIDAAGGWRNWQRHRDVSFVSTLTIFNPLGSAVSETIFLHKLPLHQGIKTRVASIGIAEEVVFGFDGEREWMVHGGRVVNETAKIAFTRFHALSTAYWFCLPFILAEVPGEITYLGKEEDGGRTLEKVRVGYPDSVPVPFDWLVIYFDAETAELDRVHVHALAEFLQHSLWISIWRDGREIDGIRVSRSRAYFAADPHGEIVGGMAGEQLIEHVEFDRGLEPDLLRTPPASRGLTTEIES